MGSEVTVQLAAVELQDLDGLNELTVQLDGLGQQITERSRLAGSTTLPGASTGPEPSEGPVFVDQSGRRSRKLRRIGWVLAVACACYAVTLVAALIGGNSRAPWLLIPGPEGEQNTGTVQEQPVPTGSSTGRAVPGGSPGAPVLDDSAGTAPEQQPGGATSGTAGNAGAGASDAADTGADPTESAAAAPRTAGGAGNTDKPVTPPTPSTPAVDGPGDEEPGPEQPPVPPADTETGPTEEPPADPAGDGGEQGLEGAQ
ncbi:hypothetical protein V1460_31665 [Streptomyces sp. SCSIO 30461]|uniref:hypothetical protein n=1 Tax=Streptomyces sp. SCSIO 30461 TaxID=3118085 RepID=UPI0030CCFF06